MIKILDKESYARELGRFSGYHYIQSAEHDYHEIVYRNCTYLGYFLGAESVILLKFAVVPVLSRWRLALGSFGPVIDFAKVNQETFDRFLKDLRVYIKSRKLVYLQLYPVTISDANPRIKELLRNAHLLRKSPRKFTALDGTMIVDLSPSLEEISRGLRKDVKYNLNRAKREAVLTTKTVTDLSDDGVRVFFKMYESHQNKKRFRDRATPFYRDLLGKGNAVLFLALENNVSVSGILAVKFAGGQSLITYISASTPRGLATRAPTLLRWELIKWAKEAGMKTVDFFSFERKNPSLAEFKMGFRPRLIKYPENAYDLVVSSVIYALAQGIGFIRRLFRP